MPPALSRAGKQPEKLGLTGTAGLQLKPPKKFGLQRPAKALARPAAASAFGGGSDDDLDDESASKRVGRDLGLNRPGGSTLDRLAVKAQQAAAIAQDADVYDYDGVYDTMQAERSAVRTAAAAAPAAEKKARYIGSIMEAHKVREIEDEKLYERKLVKEAEAEAHLYGDKEKFMTSTYRRKLEAREEYEAELKREEARDAKNDATKRGDLSHFYSNLLNDNMGSSTTALAEAAARRGGGAARRAHRPRSACG